MGNNCKSDLASSEETDFSSPDSDKLVFSMMKMQNGHWRKLWTLPEEDGGAEGRESHLRGEKRGPPGWEGGRKDCISRHKYEGKFEEEEGSAEENPCSSHAGKRAKHFPLLFHTLGPFLQGLLVSRVCWGFHGSKAFGAAPSSRGHQDVQVPRRGVCPGHPKGHPSPSLCSAGCG